VQQLGTVGLHLQREEAVAVCVESSVVRAALGVVIATLLVCHCGVKAKACKLLLESGNQQSFQFLFVEARCRAIC